MNIRTITEGFKSSYIPLRLVFPEKEYVFTSTFENAKTLDKDFVFIPLGAYEENMLQTVKAALKNPHCKGFILNKSLIDNFEMHEAFHTFMTDLDSDPEVLLLVRNIYNFANYLAERKTKEQNFSTIAITGTDKTSVAKDVIVNNLSDRKITYPMNEWTPWQKIYEPILVADYETNYAIIEVQPSCPEITLCASRFDKKHVLFTRSTIYKMDVYRDFIGLSENLLNVIADEKKVLSIYTPDYNELVSDKIPYQFTSRTHFVKSNKQGKTRLQREYAYVFEFLKSQGIPAENIKSELKSSYPLFNIVNYKNSEYFIINNQRILFENIKNTFKVFAKSNKDKKKIIVYEHILGLGMYKKPCVRELFKLFSEAKPDVLILLNTEAFNYLYKRNEQQTYLKNLTLKQDSKETKARLKKFMKGVVDEGSAVYLASPNDLSFLVGGDI